MRIRRALLPAAVLLAVMGAHALWLSRFPERDPAQARWADVPVDGSSWLRAYLDAGSHWVGYSYGVALALAAVGLRRYRERRSAASRNVAVGGFSFAGLLSVSGCFLLGCCGSPMLAVYANIFGVRFLPWAKPLIAIAATLWAAGAWWWVRRADRPRPPAVAAESSERNHLAWGSSRKR